MEKNGGYGFLIYLGVTITMAAYFAFAAVQGDLGVLKRMQIASELRDLNAQRDAIKLKVTEMENKTLRLSDHYLDLDLLDERARDVLGMMRVDDVVIQ
jgi:cell division protein FtsB